MNAILTVACIGLAVGFFLVFGISPMEFTEGIFTKILAKPNSIKSQINEAVKRKKPNVLRREITEAQEILRLTNRSHMFGILCACSLGLSALGIAVAVIMGNAFLAPVMAAGLMFVPFWYVKTTANNYKKAVSSELETALSIITTAYLRNEDIITSVEENVHYLNAPVKSVFENFVSRIKFSNPDITAAILDMKGKIRMVRQPYPLSDRQKFEIYAHPDSQQIIGYARSERGSGVSYNRSSQGVYFNGVSRNRKYSAVVYAQ